MSSNLEFRKQFVALRYCTFDTAEAAIDALRSCPPCGYADKKTARVAIEERTVNWINTVFLAAQTLECRAKVRQSNLQRTVYILGGISSTFNHLYCRKQLIIGK